MATPITASLATTNAATAPSAGSVVAFQLTGTWTGTVTFQSTIDGSNWVATQAFPVASSTGATTAAANGIWRLNGSGFAGVRCQFTTASSGTVVVTQVGYDEGQVFAT